MILGIQLLGFLFGLFMVYYSFIHFKRKEFKPVEFSFWLVLWLIFVLVSLLPNVLDPITKTLSVTRTMDLLIIVGFMFLIGVTFYNYTTIRKNQKKVEDLVRKIAIEDKK